MKLRQQTRDLREVTGLAISKLHEKSIKFDHNNRHSDITWGIVETKAGTYVSWCDTAEGEFEIHDTYDEAAEHQLEGMKVLYEQFHDETIKDLDVEVVVGRNHDGKGRLVGWSFSLDSDGMCHGYDETYGEW